MATGRGSRIVDRYQRVQDVDEFFVSFNGVQNILSAGLVADQGIHRQFWPKTLTADEPIVMTTDAGLSHDVKPVGEVAQALCNYDARTGTIIVSGYPPIPVLSPTPRATGLYLWRLDIDSGDVQGSGTVGAWVDVLSDTTVGVFEYFLNNSTGVPGQVLGQVTVQIAEDDGLGAPVGGTEVAKVISLIAELTGKNFVFTTLPWSLEDIRINEIASTQITTIPSGLNNQGISAGYEGQTLAEAEVYAVDWNATFQVKLDVISGGPITGASTGVWLPSSTRRDWYLLAENDTDNNSAEVDLSVTDGISTVAKRISMHSQRGDEVASGPVDQEFTQYDHLSDHWTPDDFAEIQEVGITITTTSAGYVDAFALLGGHFDQFPQKWHPEAPTPSDPQNFECRLSVREFIKGSVTEGSSPVGEFLNCSNLNSWTVYQGPINPIRDTQGKSGSFLLEIQEVGRPSTREEKVIDWVISVTNADQTPPGGEIP